MKHKFSDRKPQNIATKILSESLDNFVATNVLDDDTSGSSSSFDVILALPPSTEVDVETPIQPGVPTDEKGSTSLFFNNPVISQVFSTWTQRGAINPELTTILSYLHALRLLHHTSHWTCSGDNFYGDHLLFKDLYDSITDEIDSLGERIVSLGCEEDVDMITLANTSTVIVNSFNQVVRPSSVSLSSRALTAEVDFVYSTTSLYETYKERTCKNDYGLDNLISGLLDVHDSAVYKLRQRTKSTNLIAYLCAIAALNYLYSY